MGIAGELTLAAAAALFLATGCAAEPPPVVVRLEPLARMGSDPGAMAYEKGLLAVTDGSRLGLFRLRDPGGALVVSGDLQLEDASEGVIDLGEGPITEVAFHEARLVLRSKAGRLLVVGIGPQGPVLRAHLKRPGQQPVIAGEQVLSLALDGAIQATELLEGRDQTRILPAPCPVVSRLGRQDDDHVWALCEGRMWRIDVSMSAVGQAQMVYGGVSSAPGHALALLPQGLLAQVSKGTEVWASMIDLRKSPLVETRSRASIALQSDLQEDDQRVAFLGFAGNQVFLRAGVRGLRLLAIKEPAGLAELGVPRALRTGRQFAGDDVVLAMAEDGAVQIFDHRDPHQPKRIARILLPALAERLALSKDGRLAFSLAGTHPVTVSAWDLATPSHPVWRSTETVEIDEPVALARRTRLVMIGSTLLGMGSWNAGGMADFLEPRGYLVGFQVSASGMLSDAWARRVDRPAAAWLTADDQGQVWFPGLADDQVEVYQPRTGAAVRSYTQGRPNGSVVDFVRLDQDGRWLALLHEGRNPGTALLGLVPPDVEWSLRLHPPDPDEAPVVRVKGEPTAMTVAGDKVYLSMRDGALHVLQMPISVGNAGRAGWVDLDRIEGVGEAERMVATGDLLILQLASGDLKLLDVQGGSSPQPLSLVTDEAVKGVSDIAAYGDLLLSAEKDRGLTVYRVNRSNATQ